MASVPIRDELSQPAFWGASPDERERIFADLRADDPVSWQRLPASPLGPSPREGFWAIARWEDVRVVSRDAKRFCSGHGRLLDDFPPELQDRFESIIAMDDPRHARLRALVAAAFSPRTMRRLQDQIEADARQVVDGLADERHGDFVDRVSKRLPVLTVLRMLGVEDAGDAERLADLTEGVVCYSDEEALAGRDPGALIGELLQTFGAIAAERAAHRRRHPGDDVMSALVQAEVDGRRLTEDELLAFFTLLSIAANDTTRQTTSIAMHALRTHPDQRALLLEDLPGRIEPAVEEFLRWATAVAVQCRTATRDTELHGREIAEGDKVALLLTSANRDERAFADPQRFDVGRDPNPHLAFGGGGPHFCLGNALARVSLRALFTNLLSAYPQLEVGEPRWIASNALNGILRMPMDTGPRAG